jgi:alkylated DNA repair dioxygenase AlkB
VSTPGPHLVWQDALFETEPRGGRLSFAGLRRDQLDARTWIDVAPGWVPDHEDLFAWMRDHVPWRQRTRTMWDREVLEPRLVGGWESAEQLPPEIRQLTDPLSARYGVRFDSCWVNLYRDGSDAVAWHGDTNRKTLRNPLVCTVSLGARRSFLLKPRAGGPVAKRYQPGGGDLIVMGGACQHEWLHAVPRERRVSGARMSITLRHSAPLPVADPGRPGAGQPETP